MTDQWELYLFAALLALLLVVWAVKSVRARRRRSLSNKYGYAFYTALKQPYHRENVRRVG